MAKRILIAGTSSDAGKTLITAGICRILHRQGIRVAPFKARTLSLNSFVTDGGAEIGRAQAMQAQACGINPTAEMNPVLLKPGPGLASHAIVLGQPSTNHQSIDQHIAATDALSLVVEAFRTLEASYEAVICEGAGSVSEINLRESDIANLGFARATSTPALLATDIDQGGSFGALAGSLALLDAADQHFVRGFLINRFRGHRALLDPGLEELSRRTARPTVGVIPFEDGLALDGEDSIAFDAYLDPKKPVGHDLLRIAVVAYPWASNTTDIDPLGSEPGVTVHFAKRPEELVNTDLVVLPGTRATVHDLNWLRDERFDVELARRSSLGLPIIGICGGYQMLGEQIVDTVESHGVDVAGLGLLPVRTVFTPKKTVLRAQVATDDLGTLSGFEIHHGQVNTEDADTWLQGVGAIQGATVGTLWHGLFENDRFRRWYLADVARRTGRAFQGAHTVFANVRESRIDRIADLISAHVEIQVIERLLDESVEGLDRLPHIEYRLCD